MTPTAPWRPMRTAPQNAARIWLHHRTLGPILAEGRPGRWYAPSAEDQLWRWYRSAEPDALDPFSGWLPAEVPVAESAGGARVEDDRTVDRSDPMA
jgi:hypothetical protein